VVGHDLRLSKGDGLFSPETYRVVRILLFKTESMGVT
jgi:hypothetical protein